MNKNCSTSFWYYIRLPLQRTTFRSAEYVNFQCSGSPAPLGPIKSVHSRCELIYFWICHKK